jgi:hypothetical protein
LVHRNALLEQINANGGKRAKASPVPCHRLIY